MEINLFAIAENGKISAILIMCRLLLFQKSFNLIICDELYNKTVWKILKYFDILAHLAKGNVSICHQLASVVC